MGKKKVMYRAQKFLYVFCITILLLSCKRRFEVYHGTAIFCIFSDKLIIVAADSKRAKFGAGDVTFSYAGRTCKIHIKDSIIYAGAGIMGTSFYDPNVTIKNCKLHGSTLKEKVDEIKIAITDSLTLMMENVRRYNSDLFEKRLKDNQFAEYLFAAFDHGVASIAILRLYCLVDKKNVISITDSTNITLPSRGFKRRSLGETSVIDSIMMKDPDYLSKFPDPIQAIHSLFKQQSLKTPDAVNDTLNIAFNIQNNIRWIEKQQECK